MRKFAVMALAPTLFALAACADKTPAPIPVHPDHPGENPDCKYETQAGDCVPGSE